MGPCRLAVLPHCQPLRGDNRTWAGALRPVGWSSGVRAIRRRPSNQRDAHRLSAGADLIQQRELSFGVGRSAHVSRFAQATSPDTTSRQSEDRPMETPELRQRCAKIATDIRSIIETAVKESRGLQAEEQAIYDKGSRSRTSSGRPSSASRNSTPSSQPRSMRTAAVSHATAAARTTARTGAGRRRSRPSTAGTRRSSERGSSAATEATATPSRTASPRGSAARCRPARTPRAATPSSQCSPPMA